MLSSLFHSLELEVPEPSILFEFPYEIAVSICRGVVEAINKKIRFETKKQLQWTLSCLTFALGAEVAKIEDVDLMEMAVNIYTKWIFTDDRPDCIDEEIIVQLSQVFRDVPPRKNSEMEIIYSKRVEACHRVLQIFYMLNTLDLTQTSLILVRATLLAVSSSILSVSVLNKSVGNEIASHLFLVLFDSFIRSFSSEKMWNYLKEFSNRWIHRPLFFKSWSVACIGLSRRVISICNSNHSSRVILHWDNIKVTQLDLTDVAAIKIWFQFLTLFNPASIPETCDCFAIESVGDILNVFLSDGADSSCLFSLFGPWLLSRFLISNSSNILAQSVKECNTELENSVINWTNVNAIGVLTRFISNRMLVADDPKLVEKVLLSISKVLSNFPSSSPYVAAVLCNSFNIFSCDKHLTLHLVPLYLVHLRAILVDSNFSLLIRRACLFILVSIISFHHYIFPIRCIDNNDVFTKEIGLKLRHHLIGVPNLLLNTLEVESDEYNLEWILWTIVTYLHCESDDGITIPDSLVSFISLFLNSIWKLMPTLSHQSALTVLNVLTSLSSLYHSFSNVCINEHYSFLISFFPKLFYRISELKETAIKSEVSILFSKNILQLSALLNCFEHWTRVSTPAKFLPVLWDICVQSLSFGSSYSEVNSMYTNVRHFALRLSYNLTFSSDVSPDIFSILNDLGVSETLVKNLLVSSDNHRFYLLHDSTIVSIFEYCGICLLTVRDVVSMRTWKISSSKNLENVIAGNKAPTSSLPFSEIDKMFKNWRLSSNASNVVESTDIFSFVLNSFKDSEEKVEENDADENSDSTFCRSAKWRTRQASSVSSRCVETLISDWELKMNHINQYKGVEVAIPRALPLTEAEYLASEPYINTFCQRPIPPDRYNSSFHIQDTRIILSNLHLLSIPKSKENLKIVPLTLKTNLLNLIARLDDTSVLEKINISVFHRCSNFDSIESLFLQRNSPLSIQYELFLRELGKSEEANTKYTLSYCDRFAAMNFCIFSLLNFSDEKIESIIALFKSYLVRIVFNDSSSPFVPESVPVENSADVLFPYVYIIITPLDNGLFKINVAVPDLSRFDECKRSRNYSGVSSKNSIESPSLFDRSLRFNSSRSFSSSVTKKKTLLVQSKQPRSHIKLAEVVAAVSSKFRFYNVASGVWNILFGNLYAPAIPHVQDFGVREKSAKDISTSKSVKKHFNSVSKQDMDMLSCYESLTGLFGYFHHNSVEPIIGPLLSYAVVTREKLFPLLRSTICLAYSRVSALLGAHEKPFHVRANILDRIRKEMISSITNTEYFSSFMH